MQQSHPFVVNHPNVQYTDQHITSKYVYQSVEVNGNVVTPKEETVVFRTERKVPKTGVMLVGWGGNNGTTVTAGILANRLNLKWNTKDGEKSPNYYGSLSQASTVKIGYNAADGSSVHVPFNQLLPMVHPNDLVIGGWDISGMNLADAMKRAEVIDWDLQQKLVPHMKDLVPLPSIYDSSFIAGKRISCSQSPLFPLSINLERAAPFFSSFSHRSANNTGNQSDRADNLLSCSNKWDQVAQLREDIRAFKRSNSLDKVIILWTATTERFSNLLPDVHDTADHLLAAIQANHSEISPSTLFAVAALLEHCAFINGSPQNTCVPGVLELAHRQGVFVVGDDFKSGQTKMKSVLVDFFISAGIKPVCIVSYNHLGNNDGKNLSSPEQFRSKEISKTTVVDDMVHSNSILYAENEKPDHCVVIKYVPWVKDSKRAMDEYTSEIFLQGTNTIVMHNTCEDSLLAAPLILDLVILCEICERITIQSQAGKEDGQTENSKKAEFERMHEVLSALSYLLKAPLVPPGTPVVNALAAQRQCLVNLFRACVGLPPDNYMTLEHRVPTLMKRFANHSAQEARGAENGNETCDNKRRKV